MAFAGGLDMDVWRRNRIVLVMMFSSLSLAACAPKLKGDQISQTFPPPDQSPKCAPSMIKNKFVVRWKDHHHTVETAPDRETFIRTFLEPHLNEIDFVENDYKVQRVDPIVAQRTVPDPNWGVTMVKAQSAWSRNIKGAGVAVGVVDTGADITHPQLVGQVLINTAEANGQPGVDDDNNGYVDDIKGWNFVANKPLVGDNATHGTHVSGIILADPTKGSVSGMAPAAKLLPMAFLDNQGSGSTGDAIRAIQYGIQRGVKVINASWGGSGCSTTLRDLVNSMGDAGVLFTAAAGNNGDGTASEGWDIDQQPTYPASFAALGLLAQITVGASTYIDGQAWFSNFGMKSVHLVAPGMDIVSTIPNNQTASYDGTSMATPFVTGAAALLWSDRPKATLSDIKNALLNGVDPGEFLVSTTGRLDVEKSLAYLESHVKP